MDPSQIFDVERAGETLIVTLAETVGSFADDRVTQELNALCEGVAGQGATGLIVDFGQVSYIGSSMLEAMLAVRDGLHISDEQIALCNVSDVTREILHISRFDTLWPIYDNCEQALAALGN